MTRRQMKVLIRLRDAKRADPECPYIALDDVYKSTRTTLMNRGWMWVSPGLDGTKYYISVHGEKALAVFEKPVGKRYDGICPDCGVRPVHVTASGRRSGYCLECANATGRKKWAHRVTRFRSPICPSCKLRPRHKQPNGTVITYCSECDRVKKRANKEKNKQRNMERARRGELLCISCKENPRYVTEKSVYDYCESCLKTYYIEYNDRRRPNSRAARERRKVEA